MNLLEQILIPLLTGFVSSAIVVLFGVRSIKEFLVERDRKRELGGLMEFWSSNKGLSPFRIVYGRESPSRQGSLEPRLGFAEAFGVMAITNILRKVFGSQVLVRTASLDHDSSFQPSFFEENLVLLGGERSLEKFGALCRKIAVTYYQYELDSDKRAFQRLDKGAVTETITSIVDESAASVEYDIGTVVRIINPANGRLIILLNGNYSAGLAAASITITSREHFSRAEFRADAPAQQLVVGIDKVLNNMVLPDQPIEVLRSWSAFHLDRNVLREALNEVSGS